MNVAVPLQLLDRGDVQDNDILTLFVQFLPSVTITGLNIIVPVFFNGIVSFEKYAPDTELKVNIFRSVFYLFMLMSYNQ